MTQYSQDRALKELAALATDITGSSLKLGTGDPSIITELALDADYTARECTFDGYVALVLPAPLAAYHDGANKYSIQVATQQFNYVDGVGHITNRATFAWVVSAAGDVIQAFSLPSPGFDFLDNLSSLPIDLKFSRFTTPIP